MSDDMSAGTRYSRHLPGDVSWALEQQVDPPLWTCLAFFHVWAITGRKTTGSWFRHRRPGLDYRLDYLLVLFQ